MKSELIKQTMLKISIIAIIAMLAGCEKKDVSAEDTSSEFDISMLKGTWIAKSLFLSDATTGVCYQNKEEKPVTLVISGEKTSDGTAYSINGQAPVNRYFASLKIGSYDATTGIGKITMSTLGGTKMAGSAEMMECENSFYQLMSESTGFQIFAKDKRLHIGRIKEPSDTPSRDGGTFYVFEKVD